MSDHFLANMTKGVVVRLLEIHEINEVNEPPQSKSNKVWKLTFVILPSPPICIVNSITMSHLSVIGSLRVFM